MLFGTAEITVEAEDGSNVKAVSKITVENPPVYPVTGINLNKTSTKIPVGGTETLTATVVPANATNPKITWSSSNNSIATVNADSGLITGIAYGTVAITATAEGGVTEKCEVEVYPTHITHLKPGDHVNYNHNTGTPTFTVSVAESGHTGVQTFNKAAYTGGWQVMYNDASRRRNNQHRKCGHRNKWFRSSKQLRINGKRWIQQYSANIKQN
jgi:uncharacterized protein YjdB